MSNYQKCGFNLRKNRFSQAPSL